jgi:hypothetical protein
MGAGVEWSFASFWARERPDEVPVEEVELELEVSGDRFRKSVARKKVLVEDKGPWA